MWKKVDYDRYDYMLGVLPPALWLSKGFLVGEPYTHRYCKETGIVRATYTAMIEYQGSYYEGPDLTMPEFRALDPATVART